MNQVDMDDVEVDQDERHLVGGTPFTGEIVETDVDGNVVERIRVTDGWEDGLQQAWYSSGITKFEGRTRSRQPVGWSREWHENGQLAREQEFDDTGRLLSSTSWDERGVRLDDRGR